VLGFTYGYLPSGGTTTGLERWKCRSLGPPNINNLLKGVRGHCQTNSSLFPYFITNYLIIIKYKCTIIVKLWMSQCKKCIFY